MVQVDRLRQLRRDWVASEQVVCTHPNVEREYYLGSDTGDEGCLLCGESWPRGSREPPLGRVERVTPA